MTKIIVVAALILVAVLGVSVLVGQRDQQQQHPRQENSGQNQQSHQQPAPNLGRGVNEPFYSKDGLYLTHSWPGAEHFSSEETEVLIFNESDSSVEVKSFDLTYSVEGKVYPHKSGTWEKFPAKDNHERIEYLNIGANYYKGEQLLLTSGQKGKLHWHIQFGSQPLDGKQTVTVKLTLLKDGQTINIDKQFNRDSGTVFSKDEH